jgi:hypothetical protein
MSIDVLVEVFEEINADNEAEQRREADGEAMEKTAQQITVERHDRTGRNLAVQKSAGELRAKTRFGSRCSDSLR